MADSSQFTVVPTRRKVWVLNRHVSKPYKEKFRDRDYEIPPNHEKKVIMDLSTAEKFLSGGTQLQENDNAGREISMGKPLYWLDLTEDERDALDPRNKKEEKVQAKADNNRCMICGETMPTVKGLALHTTRKHPEYEPVKEL